MATVDHIDVAMTEWSTVDPREGGPLHNVFLEDDPEIHSRIEEMKRFGRLDVTELRSGLSVRTTSFVGRVSLGALRITVRPKIEGAPFLQLLRYAYSLRDLHLSSVVDHDVNKSDGFQDLIVAQLAAEAKDLLARGLHRRYVRQDEDLASPRGRIDVQRFALKSAVASTTLPSIHFPRLEDCLANQVLLAGLKLAGRLTEDLRLQSSVRRLAAQLSESVASITLNHNVWRQLGREENRLTAAYRPSFTLVRLLFCSLGVGLTESEASVPLQGFFFDMNRFFQSLLSRFLREHLPEYSVIDEYRLNGMMAYVPGFNPGHFRDPSPRPDFVVMRGTLITAILDAKYIDLYGNAPSRDIIYQLAIYALSRPTEHTATILYPSLVPNAKEAKIEVRDPLRGQSRALITIRPVDLHRLARVITSADSNTVRHERKALASHLAFGVV
jgi:5-methylcytosine-specific restriction enzyme subunit McrC